MRQHGKYFYGLLMRCVAFGELARLSIACYSDDYAALRHATSFSRRRERTFEFDGCQLFGPMMNCSGARLRLQTNRRTAGLAGLSARLPELTALHVNLSTYREQRAGWCYIREVFQTYQVRWHLSRTFNVFRHCLLHTISSWFFRWNRHQINAFKATMNMSPE